jgi:hypothetical protein
MSARDERAACKLGRGEGEGPARKALGRNTPERYCSTLGMGG